MMTAGNSSLGFSRGDPKEPTPGSQEAESPAELSLWQEEKERYLSLRPPYRKEIQSQPASRNSSMSGRAKMNQEPKFTTSHCGKKLEDSRR